MKEESKIVFKFSGRRSGLTIRMMDLILQSDKQGLPVYTNSQAMYDALSQRGIKVEFVELSGEPIIRTDDSFHWIDDQYREPQKPKAESLYWSLYDTRNLFTKEAKNVKLPDQTGR